MTPIRKAVPMLLALGFPAVSLAASSNVTTALLHILERKGLPMTQAQATTQAATQQYHGVALSSILTSIKGIPALPSLYYSTPGTLKAPVAAGLSRVLTSAFAKRLPATKVKTVYTTYTHAVTQDAPPKTTQQLTVAAIKKGVTGPKLKALIASYVAKIRAGVSANQAVQKAKKTLSRYRGYGL